MTFADLAASAYNGAGKLLVDPVNLAISGKIVCLRSDSTEPAVIGQEYEPKWSIVGRPRWKSLKRNEPPPICGNSKSGANLLRQMPSALTVRFPSSIRILVVKCSKLYSASGFLFSPSAANLFSIYRIFSFSSPFYATELFLLRTKLQNLLNYSEKAVQ